MLIQKQLVTFNWHQMQLRDGYTTFNVEFTYESYTVEYLMTHRMDEIAQTDEHPNLRIICTLF